MKSIKKDRELYLSGIQGLLYVRTILAAYRSLEEKKRIEFTDKGWAKGEE